ncbi:DUF2800 domain-containing protein [Geomicrobium sp. JCM 19038]|uniref:DUF2800 domain-containing protein n=1 Tax=Geomicrobium sp. JCM 19038 TaxID=1460635 RepID=UPI00045F249C|nr:DUF2800 domain-containing protein [Geomicrobium sp. JCM 19038]GAK08971.1 phage protein [Geomicrobium sp. JCM 19038]
MTQPAHAERAHALLSASGSSRWLNCTPSARLEEEFPDVETSYAREGTLAHEIAELKLRKYYTDSTMTKAEFNKLLKPLKENELYQLEMDKHTDSYLEFVKELTLGMKQTPFVAIEKRLDFSSYVPEGFGTGDCIIISGQSMYVIDLKYGKGVAVSAENNPQMKLYALGAMNAYGMLYDIQSIYSVVVQPRLSDDASIDVISKEDLLTWGEEVKRIADKAFKGEGEFVPGDHCKFCKAKAKCRARADQYTALDDFGRKEPELLDDKEIGAVLEKAQGLDNWIKSVKEYALKETLKGNEIPGWKAVNGRGSRSYVDIDKAFEYLQSQGIDGALLYERVPLTPPKLEKELSKKQFKELMEDTGYVVKSEGKPTLAPEGDRRKAISNVPDVSEDFK